MNLTDKHIEVIKDYLSTNLQAVSYAKFFGKGNERNDKQNAANFFKKPEVKRMVKILREQKEAALIKAADIVYTKMYSEQIATLAELDIFHTKVIRGEQDVEEVFPVREKTIVNKSIKGKLVPMVEEKILFKRVTRKPTIREKQVSASELYKRNGAYMSIRRVGDDQDDTEAAEIAKNSNVETIERFVILSSGEKIPMG